MTLETKKLLVGPEGVESPAVREAAELLASGGLVAFPTETVYGIGANADDAGAIERLRAVKARPEGKAFSIHIADPKDLRKHVNPVPVLGAKLAKKFWPGPLTIVFERNERSVGLRLPAHEVARAFLRACGVTVVAPSANESGAEPASSADAVYERFRGRIDAVLDGGEAPLRQSSTVVRVRRKGWDVLREGIISRAMIERALKMTVLFLCTGNSCRSPVAEVLCRSILAKRLRADESDLPAMGYAVQSAGTAAVAGGPASASAVVAARELGCDLSGHATRPMTVELLRNADRVYGMSKAHVQAAREMCPSAVDRIELLDPDGAEIEDPIGLRPDLFAKCVERIRTCIERRAKEL